MKILVVGLACSGKSTFAKILSEKTNLPVFHMDLIIWQRSWVKTPVEKFYLEQNNILTKENWIYEGFNLPSLMQQVQAADKIIYLRKSHLRITANYFKRLRKYRHIARPDMPKGNIEYLSLSYIKWLWKYDNKEVINEIRRYSEQKPLYILSSKREYQEVINIFANS